MIVFAVTETSNSVTHLTEFAEPIEITGAKDPMQSRVTEETGPFVFAVITKVEPIERSNVFGDGVHWEGTGNEEFKGSVIRSPTEVIVLGGNRIFTAKPVGAAV